MKLWLGIVLVGLVAALGAASLSRRSLPASPLPSDVQADRILIEKTQHRLTLFRQGVPLKAYSVALGHGGLEAKTRAGDARTPEGIYVIDRRNARSGFHLALHVSYPLATDIEHARTLGVQPGGDVMIHGIRNGLGWVGKLHRTVDWTAGCVAVTDPEIEEIARAVPDGTTVEIRP